MTRVSVFSAHVSVFLFFFLTPDTRHLKPWDLVLENRGPARRVGCPKDQFDILQCSIPPGVALSRGLGAWIFYSIGGLPNLSTPCFTKYLHWSLSMTLCRRTHSSPLFWANSSIQIRRNSRSSRVPGSSYQTRRLYTWSIDSIGATTLTYNFQISVRMAQSLLISKDD